MKIYKKATLPLGFRANGIACGIKRSGKSDLALFYSTLPGKAVGQFTTNKLAAAPVIFDKISLQKNKQCQAIIVNSGNANAFTGKGGLSDVRVTARALANALGIKKTAVLVASTGIIARRLPIAKIKKGIPELVNGLRKDGIAKAKKAILTTDTFTKEISVKFKIGRRVVTICAIAKGAGMIAPDMATMLAFIFTDATITQPALARSLKICVGNSFNCITVDGCMSTNDSVFLLANAAAGNSLIDIDKNFPIFLKALNLVCLELAKMIIYDAEGASKFIRIKVKGARSFNEAKKAALAIANSNLFKTAMYGENPNFGRIASAVGASGIKLEEKNLKIKVSPLFKKEINLEVNLSQGSSSCVVYTCDLTPEYIKVNASYN